MPLQQQQRANRLGVFGWGETPSPAVMLQVRKMQEQLHASGNLEANNLEPLPVFADPASSALPAPRFSLDAAPIAVKRLCTSDADARRRHALGKSARDELRALRFSDSVATGRTSIPDYVATPSTQDDVRQLLRFCTDARIAVVTKGGGTSVTGGLEIPRTGGGRDEGIVLPASYAGAISLDVSGLNRILGVNERDQTVEVECGVTGPQLNEYLRQHHPALCFRHYPQSYEFATVRPPLPPVRSRPPVVLSFALPDA
jgi:alkyldihydroxyacetonephosphate synthase